MSHTTYFSVLWLPPTEIKETNMRYTCRLGGMQRLIMVQEWRCQKRDDVGNVTMSETWRCQKRDDVRNVTMSETWRCQKRDDVRNVTMSETWRRQKLLTREMVWMHLCASFDAKLNDRSCIVEMVMCIRDYDGATTCVKHSKPHMFSHRHQISLASKRFEIHIVDWLKRHQPQRPKKPPWDCLTACGERISVEDRSIRTEFLHGWRLAARLNTLQLIMAEKGKIVTSTAKIATNTAWEIVTNTAKKYSV